MECTRLIWVVRVEITSIAVEFSTFLTEPVRITEAIKNSVEKLGIEHLKDKQRVAITLTWKGRMSLFPSWLLKITPCIHNEMYN